jgi:hypothetical protein
MLFFNLSNQEGPNHLIRAFFIYPCIQMFLIPEIVASILSLLMTFPLLPIT